MLKSKDFVALTSYRFDPYHSAQYFIFYPICLHKHIREFSFTQTHMKQDEKKKKHTTHITDCVSGAEASTVRKVYTYVAIFVATKRCEDCKSDEIAHPIQHPKHTHIHHGREKNPVIIPLRFICRLWKSEPRWWPLQKTIKVKNFSSAIHSPFIQNVVNNFSNGIFKFSS